MKRPAPEICYKPVQQILSLLMNQMTCWGWDVEGKITNDSQRESCWLSRRPKGVSCCCGLHKAKQKQRPHTAPPYWGEGHGEWKLLFSKSLVLNLSSVIPPTSHAIKESGSNYKRRGKLLFERIMLRMSIDCLLLYFPFMVGREMEDRRNLECPVIISVLEAHRWIIHSR